MSIDKKNVIDFIAADEKSGEARLFITDHLPWDGDHKWHAEHLTLLEDKLNAYLRFIESGEINESYPSAKGKNPVIVVTGKYPLNEDAEAYYDKAKRKISEAGFELRFDLFHDK